MKKQQPQWKRKFNYWFNEHLGKGAAQQFSMLISFIVAVMLVFGVLSVVFHATGSIVFGIWESFIHLLDPGTVSGVDTSNLSLTILMIIVTFIGMVFTGMLISVINNWLEDKLNSLRKGLSDVVEKNHLVILGCYGDTYGIISEQIEANKNVVPSDRQNPCIVVASPTAKEEIESLLEAQIPNTFNTKIIVRTGSLTQSALFDMVSLKDASAVIISVESDFDALQICLAVNAYLKRFDAAVRPHVTVSFHDKANMTAAATALKDIDADLLYFSEILGRIAAQSCRQPGLFCILSELFDYTGMEIYIEQQDAHGTPFRFEGERFGDILNCFANTTVIGVCRTDAAGKQSIIIDPPQDFIMHAGDEIIHIAEDDNSAEVLPTDCPAANLSSLRKEYQTEQQKALHLLIFDWNSGLPTILTNLDEFVAENSTALLVSPAAWPWAQAVNDSLHNITLTTLQADCMEDPQSIETILQENEITNIMFLNAETLSKKDADARTMILLLHLRRVLDAAEARDGQKPPYIITSELNISENQKLMESPEINDLIIGSDLVSHVLTQVSNDPRLNGIFAELLTAEGAEIYLRPAGSYLNLQGKTTVSFSAITTLCYEQGDIAIGWTRTKDGHTEYRLNPAKTETVNIDTTFKLIVISQGD